MPTATDKKRRFRLKFWASIGLILLSGLNDLVNWIPVLGTASGVAFWGYVYYYFYKKGLGLINWKTVSTMVIDAAIEAIPAIQAFPATIIGMILIILMIFAEDLLGVNFSKYLNPKSAVAKGVGAKAGASVAVKISEAKGKYNRIVEGIQTANSFGQSNTPINAESYKTKASREGTGSTRTYSTGKDYTYNQPTTTTGPNINTNSGSSS